MKNLIEKDCKQNSENSRYMIVLAIFMASAIIFAAWITRGSENSQAIFLILITASSTIFFMGSNKPDNTGRKHK